MRRIPLPSVKMLVIGAAVAALIWGEAPTAAGQETKPESAKPRTSEPSRAADVLSRQLDLEFKETPLKDVASSLSDRTGTTFFVRARALNDAGINLDAPVTGSFRHMKLGAVLDLLLSELDLTYVDADEAVLITTPDDAESRLVARVYDCRDLMAGPLAVGPIAPPNAIGAAPGAPRTDATPQALSLQQSHTPPAIGCGSIQGAWKVEGPAGQLIHVLTNGVDVQSWSEVGGPGTISEYRGLFVVTQTARTHDKVERLLNQLREASGLADAAGKAKVVR